MTENDIQLAIAEALAATNGMTAHLERLQAKLTGFFPLSSKRANAAFDGLPSLLRIAACTKLYITTERLLP